MLSTRARSNWAATALILLCATSLCTSACLAKDRPAPQHGPMIILAASSLNDVLPKLAAEWLAAPQTPMTYVFDSSSRLAKQLEAGAPADAFFIADQTWVKQLFEKGIIRNAAAPALFSNDLVIAVPASSPVQSLNPTELLGERFSRIAVAGESVPAGKAAREALQSAGLLSKTVHRLVNAANARGAAKWVSRAEAPVGLLFKTDALSVPGIRVVYQFPNGSHTPIEYFAVIPKASRRAESAEAFVKFIQVDPRAREILRQAGFGCRSK